MKPTNTSGVVRVHNNNIWKDGALMGEHPTKYLILKVTSFEKKC
jgi:hypothetical protein